MKIIAVIPARFASSRFHAKLMQDLGGMPVISRTYLAAVGTGLFDEVLVATDSDAIAEEIISRGGKAFRSIRQHESGSDRIAEAVAGIDADIVVNVQGDEPFIDTQALSALIEVFKNDPKGEIDLASLMAPISEPGDIANPNVVKVVTGRDRFALYFSRSPIPFNREPGHSTDYFRHIGVYAFRKRAIVEFAQMDPTPLEQAEKLEQLRYLESGRKIRMVITGHSGIGIDTPEDLERARKLWMSGKI